MPTACLPSSLRGPKSLSDIWHGEVKYITVTLHYKKKRSTGGTCLIQGNRCARWTKSEFHALCAMEDLRAMKREMRDTKSQLATALDKIDQLDQHIRDNAVKAANEVKMSERCLTDKLAAVSGAPRLALYRDHIHPSYKGMIRLAGNIKRAGRPDEDTAGHHRGDTDDRPAGTTKRATYASAFDHLSNPVRVF
nr:hypothetical protein BaRGS_030711 [Batillaria attramentaria]